MRPLATQSGASLTEEGASENPATAGQATYARAFDRAGVGDTNWAGANFAAADYGAEIASFVAAGNEPAGTEHAFDITATVQGWVTSPASNAGVVFLPTGPNDWWLASQEHATAAWRPSLTVTYTVPGGIAPIVNHYRRLRAA